MTKLRERVSEPVHLSFLSLRMSEGVSGSQAARWDGNAAAAMAFNHNTDEDVVKGSRSFAS